MAVALLPTLPSLFNSLFLLPSSSCFRYLKEQKDHI
ncbi:hypothetical protein CCACVL1_23460, partial [Corchorus capsularis]